MKTRKRILLFCLLPLVFGATIFASSYELQRRQQRQTPTPASAHSAAPRTINHAATAAPAQSGGSFNLPQTVIAGGGERSTGGTNVIEGTIGQSATTQSSGGTFAIEGGFWPGAVATQCPTITLNPATLPASTVGVVYPATQLTATGGTAPHIFEAIAGSVPQGLTLTASGLLSGTPTQALSVNLQIQATDASGCMGTRTYDLQINCPAITVNPSSVSTGTIGVAYSQNITQTGGIGTISFSVSAGALPGGLSLNPTSGLLSGVPTGPGAFNFTIRATDANNCFGERDYAVTIFCQAITIIPGTIPAGTTGVAYNQTFTQIGALAAVSFQLTGTLPTGLSFNAGTATLSGTPTQTGNFPISVSAIEPNGCAGFSSYTLVINSPNCPTITVNPSTLPNGIMGQTYNQTITATGGVAPHTFAVTLGTLPNGLTLAAGGALAGTPIFAGTFNFTVTATDANNCTGTRAYTLTLINCPAITLNPATLPAGRVGVAYPSTQLTATGGNAPHTFQAIAGSVPPGLTLTTGGLLSGTPTQVFGVNLQIQATDANGCTGTRTYALQINPAGNGLQFYPLARPIRLLDTRAGQGNCDNVGAAVSAGTSITTLARITCESITIPAAAQAIVGNITAINGSGQSGFLTIFPAGQTLPLAANMIYTPGDILSNAFTVGLNANGEFNIFCERTIDVVVDISGYYAPPQPAGLYYHPLSKPIRLLDTRAGQGNCDSISTPIAASTSLITLARTTCETLTIPAAAQAIVGNATVINGSGQTGFLTIFPDGQPLPLAANMVYFPGQILSNAFTVSLGANGKFSIFGERTIDMVIDVAGYYSNEATDANGEGLLFTPLSRPLRLLDTRAGQGNCDSVSTPIPGGGTITTLARITCETITIPATAQTIIGNFTVINQTSQTGFLTVFPDGQPLPLAANMVYFPGQLLSNAFVVGLSNTGQFNIFGERTIHAIIDVSGYFAQ